MSIFQVLLAKELKEGLRDLRTLVVALLLPLVLYPGLLLLSGELLMAGRERLAKAELTVGLSGAARALLSDGQAPPRTRYQVVDTARVQEQVSAQKLAAAVEVAPDALERLERGEGLTATLRYTKRHDLSMEAKERLDKVLLTLNDDLLRARLAQAGHPPEFARPLEVKAEDVDFKKDLGPLIASRTLPLVLVMMLFLGAFYPAIDVSAGEKERGTLETLLAAPVRPLQVMAAKLCAVSLIALGVTFVNLVGLAGTFAVGLRVSEGGRAGISLSGAQTLMLALSLIPAVLMVSGISLAVASLARSFKEAQSYLTPLMMGVLVPAMAALVPGLELSPATLFIPLLNLSLFVKAVVLGTATWTQLAAVVFSGLLGAALCIKLAANAFASESVRLGQSQSLKELFFPSNGG